jgi:PAS domain S-box-containing protein
VLRENEAVNRALRESEMRFRTLVNQSMIGIAIIEGSRLAYTNEKFNAVFGLDARQIREQELEFTDLVAPDERPLLAASLQRLRQGRSPGENSLLHGLRRAVRDLAPWPVLGPRRAVGAQAHPAQ